MCQRPVSMRTVFALTAVGNHQRLRARRVDETAARSRKIESCDPASMTCVIARIVRKRNAARFGRVVACRSSKIN